MRAAGTRLMLPITLTADQTLAGTETTMVGTIVENEFPRGGGLISVTGGTLQSTSLLPHVRVEGGRFTPGERWCPAEPL